MAGRSVVINRAAGKELAVLPPAIRKLIVNKLAAYAAEPAAFANMVVALQESGGLRMRVGDYRVIFEMTAESVFVTRIAHRREVYR